MAQVYENCLNYDMLVHTSMRVLRPPWREYTGSRLQARCDRTGARGTAWLPARRRTARAPALLSPSRCTASSAASHLHLENYTYYIFSFTEMWTKSNTCRRMWRLFDLTRCWDNMASTVRSSYFSVPWINFSSSERPENPLELNWFCSPSIRGLLQGSLLVLIRCEWHCR